MKNSSIVPEIVADTSATISFQEPTTAYPTVNTAPPAATPNPDVLGVSRHLKAKQRPIVIWPNKVLSQQCEDVTTFDDDLGQLIMDMAFTMRKCNGLGLAAPQVGISLNVIVVELYAFTRTMRTVVMINPKIVQASTEDKFSTEEGCLSVPGHFERRERPRHVVVEYKNTYGKTVTQKFQGMEAFAIQHEIDHLNGKVFVDELSTFKKSRIKKKITKNPNYN